MGVFLAFLPSVSKANQPNHWYVTCSFCTGQNVKSKDVLSNFSDFISRNLWFRFCLHFFVVTITVTKLLSKSFGDQKRL